MSGIQLFPQILSDLNFRNVKSEKELASRLRAVQRVAVAAIGFYLKVHYEPMLKMGCSGAVKTGIGVAVDACYCCLSVPTGLLSVSSVFIYEFTMQTLSHIRNKEIGKAVISIACTGLSYFLAQVYKDPEYERVPNLLEKVFQKVEDHATPFLWNLIYKK
jgi:hypothetical protein